MGSKKDENHKKSAVFNIFIEDETLYIFIFPTITYGTKPEEQSYQIIQTKADFEIRYYPPVMMASYLSESNNSSGFRYLFRYISGANESQTKISMTTPVHMEKTLKGNSMAFVLPRKFQPETTPSPQESKVQIYQSEEGLFCSDSLFRIY